MANEVGQDIARVHVADNGSFRNVHAEFFALAPVLVFTHAVNAVVGTTVRVVAKREKRGHVTVGHKPDIATLAAIASVGSAECNRPLSAKTDTAGTAVASTYV